MLNTFNALSARIDTLTGFQRWGPDANPLIRQAQRRTGRLSLRGALWLAFGIGLLGAAITSWQFLRITTDRLSPFDWLVVVLGWSFYGLTPFVISLWAVMHTRRMRRSTHFDVLYLTPLPNVKLIEAFVFETLYTMRYTLALLIGIMPALIIKTLHVMFVVDTQLRVRYTMSWPPTEIDPPSAASMVFSTLFALAIALGVWGLILLAAVVGVHMGLLRRNTELAFIGAPISLLSTFMCPCMVCLWSIPAASIPAAQLCGPLIAASIPIWIGVLPYLLAINGVLTTAKRWPR